MSGSETGYSEENGTIQSIDLGDVPFIQVSDNYSIGQSKEGLIRVWNTLVSHSDEGEVQQLFDDKDVALQWPGPIVKEEGPSPGNRNSISPNLMITNIKQEAIDEFEAGTSCAIPPNIIEDPAIDQCVPQHQLLKSEGSGLKELISLPDGGRIVITQSGKVEFQPACQTPNVGPISKDKQLTNLGTFGHINSSGNDNIKRNLDVCSPVSAYWSKKKKTDTDFLNAPVAEELKLQVPKANSDTDKSEEDYECTLCGEIFSEEACVRSHLQKKHKTAKFICCFCGFSGNTEKCMDQHVENKHPVKIWKCQWFGCGYWSVNYSSVAGHYTSNHKSYLVEQCERVKPGTSQDKYRDLQSRKWKRVNLSSLPD